MIRLHSRSPIPDHLRGAVVALGNFDGFHRGHQAVVGEAIRRARAEGRPAIVATFDPHPKRYFKPDTEPFRLTTLDQREELFAEAGADATVDAAGRREFDHVGAAPDLKPRRPPTIVGAVAGVGRTLEKGTQFVTVTQ